MYTAPAAPRPSEPIEAMSVSPDISFAQTEAWRHPRLERVIGYISALSKHYSDGRALRKIHALEDHEGNLTVAWRVTPLLVERQFVEEAWEYGENECRDNVEHIVL